jgi:hypothetical protein
MGVSNVPNKDFCGRTGQLICQGREELVNIIEGECGRRQERDETAPRRLREI